VFTISAELQSGESVEEQNLPHQMGAPEQMKIYSVHCYIFPGFFDIGPSDDYATGRRTYTDIDPLYIPVRDNPDRPDDSEDTEPLYVTLPVCCDPRPWTDVDLSLSVNSNDIPSFPLDLSIIHNSYEKALIFTTPIYVGWEDRFYYGLVNNNPVTADWDTFTKLKIMLNGEVVNVEALRRRYEQLDVLRKKAYMESQQGMMAAQKVE